ncbi:MAG: hypothetical protein L0387_04920, partial [Acidobacteria bacterium]|nr:hypothetical protein [Acidobacteriota bacterium]
NGYSANPSPHGGLMSASNHRLASNWPISSASMDQATARAAHPGWSSAPSASLIGIDTGVL